MVVKKSYKLKKKKKEVEKIKNKSSNLVDDITDLASSMDEIIIDECVGYEALPSVLPAVENIYAIGDIHGDLKVAIDSLHLSKVINKDYKTLINEKVISKELLNNISEKKTVSLLVKIWQIK